MENIIYIVISLVFISVVSKLSLQKFWISIVFSLILMLLCLSMENLAINSNKNQIIAYMNSNIAQQYVAIIASLEFALLISLAFRYKLKDIPQDLDYKRMTWAHKLRLHLEKPLNILEKYYVSLLIIPCLYFILTQAIFMLPGMDFKSLSLIVSGAVFISLILANIGIRRLLPLEKMRKDFALVISLLMCLLALYITNSNILIYKEVGLSRHDYKEAFFTLIFFTVLFILGFILQSIKKFKIKKI